MTPAPDGRSYSDCPPVLGHELLARKGDLVMLFGIVAGFIWTAAMVRIE